MVVVLAEVVVADVMMMMVCGDREQAAVKMVGLGHCPLFPFRQPLLRLR